MDNHEYTTEEMDEIFGYTIHTVDIAFINDYRKMTTEEVAKLIATQMEGDLTDDPFPLRVMGVRATNTTPQKGQ
jgi:hypothetical protein